MAKFNLSTELSLRASRGSIAGLRKQVESGLQGINVNVAASGKLRDVSKSFNQASKSARSFGDSVRLAGKRYSAFILGAGGLTTLAFQFRNLVSESIKYETQLAKLVQVSGRSRSTIGRLGKDLRQVAIETGVAGTELASVTRDLIAAGFKINQVQGLIKTVAQTKLGSSFSNDLGKVTDALILLREAFKIQVPEQFIKSLNSIAGVGDAFASDADSIVTGLSKAGASFSQAGGNVNEFIAVMSTMKAVTQESNETIGTTLRQITNRLQSVQSINLAEKWGLDFLSDKGLFVGPYNALKQLADLQKSFPQGSPAYIQFITDLVGQRQAGRLIATLSGWEQAQQALNVAQTTGNKIAADASQVYGTLENSIKRAKESWLSFTDTFTDDGPIKSTIQGLINLTGQLGLLAKNIAPILPALALMGGARLLRGAIGSAAGAVGAAAIGRSGFSGGGLDPALLSQHEQSSRTLLRTQRVLATNTELFGKKMGALLMPIGTHFPNAMRRAQLSLVNFGRSVSRSAAAVATGLSGLALLVGTLLKDNESGVSPGKEALLAGGTVGLITSYVGKQIPAALSKLLAPLGYATAAWTAIRTFFERRAYQALAESNIKSQNLATQYNKIAGVSGAQISDEELKAASEFIKQRYETLVDAFDYDPGLVVKTGEAIDNLLSWDFSQNVGAKAYEKMIKDTVKDTEQFADALELMRDRIISSGVTSVEEFNNYAGGMGRQLLFIGNAIDENFAKPITDAANKAAIAMETLANVASRRDISEIFDVDKYRKSLGLKDKGLADQLSSPGTPGFRSAIGRLNLNDVQRQMANDVDVAFSTLPKLLKNSFDPQSWQNQLETLLDQSNIPETFHDGINEAAKKMNFQEFSKLLEDSENARAELLGEATDKVVDKLRAYGEAHQEAIENMKAARQASFERIDSAQTRRFSTQTDLMNLQHERNIRLRQPIDTFASERDVLSAASNSAGSSVVKELRNYAMLMNDAVARWADVDENVASIYQRELDRTVNSLEKLSNVNERLKTSTDKLAALEENRQYKMGLLEEAALDSRRFVREHSLARQAFEGGITNMSEEQRQTVRDVYMRNPEQKAFGTDVTFKEAWDNILLDWADKSGIDTTGLKMASTDIKNLKATQEAIVRDAESAMMAIVEIMSGVEWMEELKLKKLSVETVEGAKIPVPLPEERRPAAPDDARLVPPAVQGVPPLPVDPFEWVGQWERQQAAPMGGQFNVLDKINLADKKRPASDPFTDPVTFGPPLSKQEQMAKAQSDRRAYITGKYTPEKMEAARKKREEDSRFNIILRNQGFELPGVNPDAKQKIQERRQAYGSMMDARNAARGIIPFADRQGQKLIAQDARRQMRMGDRYTPTKSFQAYKATHPDPRAVGLGAAPTPAVPMERPAPKSADFPKPMMPGAAAPAETGAAPAVQAIADAAPLYQNVVQNMMSVSTQLTTAAEAMKGLEITMRVAPMEVHVLHNGAQMFSMLTVEIQRLVTSTVKTAINNMLSQKFGLPPMD